ncbi:hypothetical protein ABW19_dt0200759 [Dactylella cylindrospora]|nr:hypothetical protein ABW19_dt0200759 [Dactylella cylindrospora]
MRLRDLGADDATVEGTRARIYSILVDQALSDAESGQLENMGLCLKTLQQLKAEDDIISTAKSGIIPILLKRVVYEIKSDRLLAAGELLPVILNLRGAGGEWGDTMVDSLYSAFLERRVELARDGSIKQILNEPFLISMPVSKYLFTRFQLDLLIRYHDENCLSLVSVENTTRDPVWDYVWVLETVESIRQAVNLGSESPLDARDQKEIHACKEKVEILRLQVGSMVESFGRNLVSSLEPAFSQRIELVHRIEETVDRNEYSEEPYTRTIEWFEREWARPVWDLILRAYSHQFREAAVSVGMDLAAHYLHEAQVIAFLDLRSARVLSFLAILARVVILAIQTPSYIVDHQGRSRYFSGYFSEKACFGHPGIVTGSLPPKVLDPYKGLVKRGEHFCRSSMYAALQDEDWRLAYGFLACLARFDDSTLPGGGWFGQQALREKEDNRAPEVYVVALYAEAQCWGEDLLSYPLSCTVNHLDASYRFLFYHARALFAFFVDRDLDGALDYCKKAIRQLQNGPNSSGLTGCETSGCVVTDTLYICASICASRELPDAEY